MSSSATVRRERRRAAPAPPGRRARRATSWPRARATSASSSAASSLSSTTRTRSRRAGAAPRSSPCAAAGARGARRRAAGERQAHRELAAAARPVAVRARRCRRAARPGCARAPGRGRGRPAARSSALPPCTNRSKMRGSSSGRCRCRCRGRDHALRRPRASRRTAIAPAGSGVLGGVGEQVGDHLREARRVGVEHQRRRRPRRCAGGGGGCSSSGLGISTACATTPRRARRARVRSSILPRVMRETSSRSSTRRTRCVHLALDDRAARAGRAPSRAAVISSQRGDDRRERVAQLVAEHRQELVLGAVRALGLLACRLGFGIEPCVVERERGAAGDVTEQRRVVGADGAARLGLQHGERAEGAAARDQRRDRASACRSFARTRAAPDRWWRRSPRANRG